MTSLNGEIPINLPMTADEGIAQEGLVFKVSSNKMTICTAKGDTAVGVADTKLVDAEQTARTARAGERCGFFLIGSGKRVWVASIASQTYAMGQRVFLDNSTNGMVRSDSETSSRPIGHYIGEGETTSSSNGDLIPVLLDEPIGAALA